MRPSLTTSPGEVGIRVLVEESALEASSARPGADNYMKKNIDAQMHIYANYRYTHNIMWTN